MLFRSRAPADGPSDSAGAVGDAGCARREAGGHDGPALHAGSSRARSPRESEPSPGQPALGRLGQPDNALPDHCRLRTATSWPRRDTLCACSASASRSRGFTRVELGGATSSRIVVETANPQKPGVQPPLTHSAWLVAAPSRAAARTGSLPVAIQRAQAPPIGRGSANRTRGPRSSRTPRRLVLSRTLASQAAESRDIDIAKVARVVWCGCLPGPARRGSLAPLSWISRVATERVR